MLTDINIRVVDEFTASYGSAPGQYLRVANGSDRKREREIIIFNEPVSFGTSQHTGGVQLKFKPTKTRP